MKKIDIKIWAGALLMFFATSCDDFLNVNENPNQPTVADVQLVLPNAIVASASLANQFNSYGGHFGGFIANAGGFSGFGTLLTYNLTPNDYNAMWVNTYQDPLADLQYVIEKTEGVSEMGYFNAAAKIMSVVNYQRLVDAFGDIPYTEALRGDEGINAPVYDDAAGIYASLLATLDNAIATIDATAATGAAVSLKYANDPLFGVDGDADDALANQLLNWKQYANTLKLRMLVRTNGSFASLAKTFPAVHIGGNPANAEIIPGGSAFITDDAIVDPGYEKNRPNPTWATWGRTTADALANSSRVPTTFAFAFYNGAKISDSGRGETLFVNFPAGTPHNQLGNEVGNPTIVAGQVTWASNQAGLEGTGVLKGPGMGAPLMLLAEAKFLLAEAELTFDVDPSNDVTALYYDGIEASFAYLYKDENEAMVQAVAPLVATYLSANDDNPLVEIEAAVGITGQLEAIITQKYIALNMINSDEAWNEYRRTGFPATVPGGGPAFDIASNKSNVTSRPDRLPTRVMYPVSEQSFNASNYRTVDFTSELIFWDPN